MKAVCSFLLSCFLASAFSQNVSCGNWHWRLPSTGDRTWTDVFFLDPQTGWVAGQNTIRKTTDGGLTWDFPCTPGGFPGGQAGQLFFANNTVGCFQNGTGIWRTADGGATWTAATAPLASGETVTDLWLASPSVGWAVTSGTTSILKTTNGGVSWSAVPFGQTASGSGQVQFLDANTGYVLSGTWFHELLKTTNGGASWQKINPPANGDFGGAMWFTDASTGFVCSSSGDAISKTTDGGQTWATSPTNPDYFNIITDIRFLNTAEGWAVGDYGEVLHTADGGDTWAPFSMGILWDQYSGSPRVFPVSSSRIWATATVYYGTLLRSDDGAAHWAGQFVPQSFGTGNGQGCMDFASPATAFYTNGSLVMRSTDDGTNWSTFSTAPLTINDLSLSNEGSAGLAAGNAGGNAVIARSANGYKTFTLALNVPNGNFLDLARGSDNNLLAVGEKGLAYRSSDGGLTWTISATGVTHDLRRATFADANTCWAVGAGGFITKSLNGGGAWKQQASGTTKTLRDILFMGTENGYAVGEGGLLLRTNDGGENWWQATVPTTDDLVSIAALSTTDVRIFSPAGFVLKSADQGASWSKEAIGGGPIAGSNFYLRDTANGWVAGPSTLIQYGNCTPKVNPVNAAICSGETYPFNDQGLKTSGTYTAIFIKPGGCDSTVVLNLTVKPTVAKSLAAEICSGETYPFNGQNLTATGTYQATLTAANGCDSTVTLVLTVKPEKSSILTATICAGEVFPFNGQNLTATGSYQSTLAAANGCDSTVTLFLTVKPVKSSSYSATLCLGGIYDFYGTSLFDAGTFTKTLTAANGCDSTITLHLSLNLPVVKYLGAVICSNESYFFNGQNLTASGSYSQTLTAANGCDSTVNLTLLVRPASATSLSAEICSNESYFFDGKNLTTSGVYQADLTAANGCDSTVTLYLSVKPTAFTSLSAEICSGESYFFNGQNLTSSGDYSQKLTAANGCDSTVTLHLTVNPKQATSLAAAICLGQSYFFNGQNLTATGTYTANLTTAAGCDSTVTLTLTVATDIGSETAAAICPGQSYFFNNQNLTVAGDYAVKLTSLGGCDSTVTLHLTVKPLLSASVAAAICIGETYSFNGQDLSIAGVYTATVPGSNGCDSTVTLSLSVNQPTHFEFSDAACIGQAYVFNGVPLFNSGDFTATLTGSNGCDSVVTLHLTVGLLISSINQVGGNSLVATGVATHWQWLDCNNGYAPFPGATDPVFTPGMTGEYALEASVNGCIDTSVCFHVEAVGMDGPLDGGGVSVYPNPTGSEVWVELTEPASEELRLSIRDALGRMLFERRIDGKTGRFSVDFSEFPAGAYFLAVSGGGLFIRKIWKE